MIKVIVNTVPNVRIMLIVSISQKTEAIGAKWLISYTFIQELT